MLAGMSDQLVVAVLGRGLVAPETPILRADDLGVLRGDGIFETLHVRDGQPWLLAEHLNRLANSARRMELPLPGEDGLRELVAQALSAWPATGEGALRIMVTRGPEAGGTPTVFVTIRPVPGSAVAARRDGLRVRTATLGYTATARPSAPWLLGGAKTLSYAVNMASQRYAAATGAQDVLWLSSDGYALEAPTSTLVWLVRGTLCTVPADSTGILAGTTARWLLDHAADLGYQQDERMVTVPELLQATGVWLASSVRGLVEVRRLDDADLGPSAATAALQDAVGYPR